MCLAIPGQVVEITAADDGLALVDIAGVRRSTNVSLVDGPGQGVQPGDWVLVHVGFAMSVIDEHEAAATLRLLQDMGEEFELEMAEIRDSVDA